MNAPAVGGGGDQNDSILISGRAR